MSLPKIGMPLIFVILFSATAKAALTAEPTQSIVEIARKSSPAIVLVAAALRNGQKIGSGFLISPDGVIATNFHILQNSVKAGIKLKDGRIFNNVRLLASDPLKNLALLKIDAHGLAYLPLGDSNHVQVGERLISIANPLGLQATVSDGLMSAIRPIAPSFKVFQITAPVSSGSSGGPLLNLRGEAIGITTGTYPNAQNINFAIPINYLKRLLPQSTMRLRAENAIRYTS